MAGRRPLSLHQPPAFRPTLASQLSDPTTYPSWNPSPGLPNGGSMIVPEVIEQLNEAIGVVIAENGSSSGGATPTLRFPPKPSPLTPDSEKKWITDISNYFKQRGGIGKTVYPTWNGHEWTIGHRGRNWDAASIEGQITSCVPVSTPATRANCQQRRRSSPGVETVIRLWDDAAEYERRSRAARECAQQCRPPGPDLS